MDPLRNAEGRARGRRHVTVRDGKAGLPYSKGLMATSVMGAGLPPYEAFHVAEVIDERPHRLPPREAAIVVPTVISIDDRQVHRSHFVARAADTRRGGDRRCLNHFDDIRKIQDYVHALALEHGVPVISSHALDATVQRVMELVVSAATDAPHLEPRPAPRVPHQTNAEAATGG
ncbi:MAG: hypothetical protein ACRDYX_11930 [Egibacteraceae bacterium]